MRSFEPTLPAAHARLAAVNPEAYARTRNALDGAVTRLSPYLTHGLLSLRADIDPSLLLLHALKEVTTVSWATLSHTFSARQGQ